MAALAVAELAELLAQLDALELGALELEPAELVTRGEWGARYGRGEVVALPWREVVIHTAAAPFTATAPELEARHVRGIETYHVQTKGWDGIAYSFLVAPSGRVYEGRGWGRSGAHTEGRNRTAAGLCLLGHGDLAPATAAQWSSSRRLIAHGIRLGALEPAPAISPHARYSTSGKTCPGTKIAPHIGQLAGIALDQEDPHVAAIAAQLLEQLAQLRTDVAQVRADVWVAVDYLKRAQEAAARGEKLAQEDYRAQLIALAELRDHAAADPP